MTDFISVAASMKEVSNSSKVPTTDMWANIACENLSSRVRAVSDQMLPSGFPQAAELEHQVHACAPHLKTMDAVDLFNATYVEQPEYRQFTRRAGSQLAQREAIGEKLPVEDARRFEAIKSFPNNPVAAFVESQRLSGVILNSDENNLLAGAREFDKNPYAAQLSAKERSNKISPPELALLGELRANKKQILNSVPASQPGATVDSRIPMVMARV